MFFITQDGDIWLHAHTQQTRYVVSSVINNTESLINMLFRDY